MTTRFWALSSPTCWQCGCFPPLPTSPGGANDPERSLGGPSALASQILNPLTLVHAYTVGWSATTSRTSMKSSLSARPRCTSESALGALGSSAHFDAVMPPAPPEPLVDPDAVAAAAVVGVS